MCARPQAAQVHTFGYGVSSTSSQELVWFQRLSIVKLRKCVKCAPRRPLQQADTGAPQSIARSQVFLGPSNNNLACLLSSLLSEDRRPIDTLPLAVPRCKVPQSRMASATEINQSQTTRPAYLRVASTLRLPTGYRHDLFTHRPHRIPRHRLRTFDADKTPQTRPLTPTGWQPAETTRRITRIRFVRPCKPLLALTEVRAFTAFILIRGTQQVPPLMQ